jgi:hypothetical protein
MEAKVKHRPAGRISLTWFQGQLEVGSSAGAARPRQRIGDVQRSAQAGQKPAVEDKAKCWPDWFPNCTETKGESLA